MDEGQSQREKRKLQNRIAQRRFRSRKKGTDPIFLHPSQKNAESVSGCDLHTVLATSCDLPDTLSTAAQSEFQSFGGDMDFNSILAADTPEDLFLGMSGALVSKPWLRPPYVLSPPSEDAYPAKGWKGYDSLGCQADPAIHLGMEFKNHPSNAGRTFTLTDCLKSPRSTDSAKKAPRRARSRAETVPLDAVSGLSPAVLSAPEFNDQDSEYPFPNTHQYLQMKKQRSSSARNNKKHAGCCVAHKAEMMVSELQQLYNYGVRFGFFETEDAEVEDCLGFLKRKLKDMAQCSDGDAGFSSSSDSDVK